MLFRRRYLRGATNLEKESDEREAENNHSHGQQEFPTSHEEPEDYESDIQRKHGEVAIGKERRPDAAGGCHGAREGGENQPHGSNYIDY